MSVKLRWQQLKDGRKSAYLDVYYKGKRWAEFLSLYTTKGTTSDKKHNQQVREQAEDTRLKRELALQSEDYGIVPRFMKDTDFLAYFQKFFQDYQNKDIRLVKGALTYFTMMLEDKGIKSLPVKKVDEQLCRDFKHFLEVKVNGETVHDYFKKFRAVIRRAVKERLISMDFTADIKVPRAEGLKKDILTLDEIDALSKAQCGNDQVRRAFFFSLNTGLRWCDVKELKWKNIVNGQVVFVQSKTMHTSKASNTVIDLNVNAQKAIGARGEPESTIFTLPTHTGCRESLKTWTKRAGITKHITWHCARHTSATILLELGASPKTVSDILGHSDLRQVNTYLRAIDESKKKAVNRMPEIQV